jgi:hypothetical protein
MQAPKSFLRLCPLVNFTIILHTAFASIFKKLQSQTVSREKLQETLSYKKGVGKILLKLTAGRHNHCPALKQNQLIKYALNRLSMNFAFAF